jgi:hypothetical protein
VAVLLSLRIDAALILTPRSFCRFVLVAPDYDGSVQDGARGRRPAQRRRRRGKPTLLFSIVSVCRLRLFFRAACTTFDFPPLICVPLVLDPLVENNIRQQALWS